ncbi:MAG: hypothetical protein H6766_00690 [Candidatus Peribacteria bacterium]|nr:MAG: hypothetical protein H6766_00690 [Candidatus Peribacteria bacterium]
MTKIVQGKDIAGMIDTSITYDAEDQKILQEIAQDSYTVDSTQKTKDRFQSLARSTKMKKKPITIRIFEHDIAYYKNKSKELGIPYQTLIASQIHQSTQAT